MHIPTNVFWDMSIKEVTLAMKGFSEYNGGKDSSPMDKDELDKMKELYPDY